MALNDPIDSRQLQIFLRLASEGSLKKAAEGLFLTTSAISHSISNLESDLGVKLFHRSGRGLVLTSRGEFLAKQGGIVLAQLTSLRRQLADESISDRSTLRIAVGHSYLNYLLPDVAREFSECFRRVSLHVRAADREEAIELARTHEVDAAILVDPPPDDSECASTRLFEDRFVLGVSRRHPLSEYERVPVRKLNEQSLAMAQMSSHTANRLQNALSRRGVRFRESMELGSLTAVLAMVRLGGAVALLPTWLAHQLDDASIELRPVDGFEFSRVWSYYYPRSHGDSLSNRSFRRLCEAHAEILQQRAELVLS